MSFLPVDAHTEKVMTVGTNKLPRSEAPKVYTRLEDLPTDDTIVTFFMPLDYVSPAEASGIFQLTAPPHTYGQYVPAPSAQGIILTEEASVVRELISLKDLIDVPPAKVSTEFITLNRADSDTVVAELDKMLNIGPNGQPVAAAGPNGSVVVRPVMGNGAPMSDEKNLLSGPAIIVSDPRSNRVIITTRPVNMPFLRTVVGQLDQPAANTEPQRYELRYVTAADILPAIEAALAEGKDQLQQVKQDQQTAQSGANRTGQPGGGTAAPASTANTGGELRRRHLDHGDHAAAGAADRERRPDRADHRQHASHGRQPFQLDHRVRFARRGEARLGNGLPARPQAAAGLPAPPSSEISS